jgi:hypothetical protein
MGIPGAVTLGLFLVLLATPQAAAQAPLPDVSCPTNLNSCTANDLGTTVVAVAIRNNDLCNSLTDTLDVRITAEFESTASNRYDVGIFVSKDGGTVQEPSSALLCAGAAPQVGDGNANAFPDADTDLFLDQEGSDPDTCGDVNSTAGPVRWTFDATVTCNIVQVNGEGQLVIPSCRVWDQNENNDCTSLTQAGTGSKCDCTDLVVTTDLNPCATTICNDDNACTDDACRVIDNGEGGLSAECVYTNDNTNTCGSPATSVCDAQDVCEAGVCVDKVADAGTTCRVSAGECDLADVCTGDSKICTDAKSTEVCRGAAGECDVAESCNGTSNTCPADGFDPAGTACGSAGDSVCDNPDTCNAAGVCQVNNEPNTTTCRADAGLCDVPELCDGAGSCPADGFEPAGTACGSRGDSVCDNPDSCNAAGACQVNNEPAGTTCRPDAGECDVAEVCDSAGACPADGFEPVTTACGSASDTACDAPDHCSGTDASCVDAVDPNTTTCREDAGECDVVDKCDGTNKACPADAFEPEDTACGSTADNECTDPDTCDGAGSCQANNTACGDAFITNSSLCPFDEYPTVGVCSNSQSCCQTDADCGTGGTCDNTDQFRLIFTPDVQVWPGYKATASNPGQTYYNLIVTGAPTEVQITIPYPYVTVGAMPVHVYCAQEVDINDDGCFLPPAAVAAYSLKVTMSDWINGTNGCQNALAPVAGDNDYPFEAGNCTITVPLPADACDGEFYVNAHLDYGLKGGSVDGTDDLTTPDRYDAMNPSSWGTWDAYVDVGLNLTPNVVAINDCTPYTFGHNTGGSDTSDTVYSVNTFKRIAGVFNQITTSANGGKTGVPGVTATLKNAKGDVVTASQGDADGYTLLAYKHTGKAATFTVTLYIPGVGVKSQNVQLKANGWAEASYDVTTGTWYVQSVGTK